MYQPSTFEEFQERAQKGNIIPVSRVIMADLETPVTAFIKLARDNPHAFLLESVEQGEKLGRYSFIGTQPSQIFSCVGNTLIQQSGATIKEHPLHDGKDPLHVLKEFISRFEPAPVKGLPPFFGGFVGYMNYEMTRFFEPLHFENRDDYQIPEAVFYFADTVVIFDHFDRTITVVNNVDLANKDLEKSYQKGIERIDAIVQKLREPLPQIPFGAGMETPPEVKTNWEKEDFQDAVDRCMEYIKSGDTYQIQVGIRSEVELASGPLDLYRALRRINPSPYTFFFRYENLCLVGGSPEILVKQTHNHVIYRPIAGTRKRGKTAEEDKFLENELINDAKEQAEHIMLVDLGRNDVGRVCSFHTVNVTDLMYVERYSHVMHLVSNIEGDLLDEKDGFDLLRVTFPAGTVTGSPKIRSMEIIEELERTKRGPYAGAVGWYGLNGDLDFCITLRTIVVVNQTAYVQASAGIVADSNRDFEYEEVMNKSRAMLRAIEMAECFKE